jgi:hypothetical protein
MSQNTQNPYFWTLDGTTLQIVGANYISIYVENASGGDSAQVANDVTGQSMNVPMGCVLELSPDTGCTLESLTILQNGSNLVYVTMIGGIGQLI